MNYSDTIVSTFNFTELFPSIFHHELIFWWKRIEGFELPWLKEQWQPNQGWKIGPIDGT